MERLLLPLSVRARLEPGFHQLGQGELPALDPIGERPDPPLRFYSFPLLLKSREKTKKIVRDPLGLPFGARRIPTPLSSGISPSHSR